MAAFPHIVNDSHRWHSILASVGDGVIVVDAGSAITYLNPAAEKLTGWARDEAIGLPVDQVFSLLDERSLQPVDSPVAAVLSTGATVELSNHVVLVTRSGGRLPIEDSAAPLRGSEEELTGVVIVFHDATSRRRALQRFVLQAEAARVVAAGEPDHDIFPDLLAAIGESLGWEWATLWQPDVEDERLTSIAVWSSPAVEVPEFSKATREMQPARGEGFPGRVWASGKPDWIADAGADAAYLRQQVARREGIRSSLALPVLIEGSVAAVIELVSLHERQVDDELLAALQPVGLQIGLLLRQRLAQREAHEREAVRQAILMSALDAMITIDHNGCVLDWNPPAERMFGYSRSEVRGHQMAEFIVPPDLRPMHYAGFSRYLETGEGPVLNRRIEIRAMRRGGEEFPVELAIVPIRVGGKPMFTGYLRDISDRKKSEESLKRQAEDLAQAAKQKDLFLAMLAHELRNPLAPITNAVDVLERSPTDPRVVVRMSNIISRHATHLKRLVDDLLDVSRASRGKIDLRLQQIDLAEIVRQKSIDFSESARLAGVEFVTEIPPGSFPLMGDPTRLDQVIGNLLGNAIKFTPTGGSVRIQLERCEDRALITVTDTGIGITSDLMPLLFEPFMQGDTSLDRSRGGLGLGLAIARSMAEMHGGRVRAESPGAGKGCTFVLELPMTVPPHIKMEPAREGPEQSDHRPSLLLIEDVADTADTLAELLELEGFGVRVAYDGESGLSEAHRMQPDIILCDIGLPRMDGLEVARRLRAEPDFAQTHLVALSGYGTDEDFQKTREAGFDMHLVKPVGVTELVDHLRKLTGGENAP